MPNWCHSELIVKGDKEDIKKFKKLFMEGKRIVNTKIISYPREFELLDKINRDGNNYQPTEEEEKELMVIYLTGKYKKGIDGYNQGGYEWCCKFYGSKWGICECTLVEETEENIDFIFKSAWSPSTPLVMAMSKKLPDLIFDFNCQEETADYAFNSTWKGGKEIKFEDTVEDYCKSMEDMYAEDEKIVEELNEIDNVGGADG